MLGLVAFVVLLLIAWWLYRQLPHDGFEPLPNVEPDDDEAVAA